MYFDNRTKRIYLTEKDGVVIEEENCILIEGKYFFLREFENDTKSIGGNSSVFLLYDKDGIEETRVIKFCNYHKPNKFSNDWIKRRFGRFINEIDALKKVKNFNISSNIISIFDDGVWEISGKEFLFYTMEKADNNLKIYLLANGNNVDFVERIKLIKDIFYGVMALHELNFYHRDIKPDNILLFYLNEEDEEEGRKITWKIGDLGLIAHRDIDYDDIGEKIGPIGWLSPEAMNKHLTEKFNIGLDCSINEYSDIFQLGKLFWFIFEYNIPIGQIKYEDFTYDLPTNRDFVFNLIFGMLQYPKNRRLEKKDISDRIELLTLEFGL